MAVALLHDIGENARAVQPWRGDRVDPAAVHQPRQLLHAGFITGSSKPTSSPPTSGWTQMPATDSRTDPAYVRTVEFCAKYDEVSFDPGSTTNEPLSVFFEPTARCLLAKKWVPPQ